MVAAGYDWKKGCWSFGPTASFEYTYVELNSFTEDTLRQLRLSRCTSLTRTRKLIAVTSGSAWRTSR